MNNQSESATNLNFYSLFEEDNNPFITPPDFRELINHESLSLLTEELNRLLALDENSLNEELQTYNVIVNYKIGSKIDYSELKFNPEFAPFLEKVLIFIAALKFRDHGIPLSSPIQENIYAVLKILTYKALLLPVNLKEAKEVLGSLAFLLSAKDNKTFKSVSTYIISQVIANNNS